MTEIQQSFFLNNLDKITRNYNAKAQNNSPVLNTIFNWFDADGNGTFNDEEWTKKENYVKNLKEKLSANYDESVDKESAVVKFYRKQLNSKLKEIKQTDIEAYKIYEKENYFIKLLDFEKAHGIERYGYNKKTEIPEDVVTVNMSIFEMGMLDAQSVGKTYKKGYVKFPDNISEDDRNTYFELLKKAQEQGKQFQKSIHKWLHLEKEYESAIENYKNARNGQITKIGFQTNNQQNQAIRESSNPYYKQYKEMEQKYNALRIKGLDKLTDEEANLLIQLPQIMRQLKNASLSGVSPKNSGSNSSTAPKAVTKSEASVETVSEPESNGGLRVTNIDEKLSYNVEDDSKELHDEHALGLGYVKGNWEVSVSGSKTEKYSDGKPEHEGFFNLGATYTKGKCTFSPELEFSGTNTTGTWTPSFTASYNDNSNSIRFKAGRAITTVSEKAGDNKNEQNTAGTTYSTDLELEWQKMFKNGTSANMSSNVKFDKNQGNEYMISFGATTPLLRNKLAKHNLAWSVSGNFMGNYYDSLKATNIEPSLSTSLNYNKNDFSADVSLNENISIISIDGETIPNSMFTASGAVGYKQLTFNAGYSSTQNSYLDMTSVNAGASYSVPKLGKFSLTGSISGIKTGETKDTNKEYNVSLGYSAPLDIINGWFSKKSNKNK